MSDRVEFSAPCFGAHLAVSLNAGQLWSMTLFTFVGTDQSYQPLAHVACPADCAPKLDVGDDVSGPSLWMGNGAIDVPQELVPKLQAFLAEHGKGGAA